MRLVTFQAHGRHAEPGLLQGETLINLAGAGFASVIDIIAAGAEGRKRIEAFAAAPPANFCEAPASVKMLAPIPRPPKIICVGLNYRDHAAESKMEIPSVPTIFSKFGNTITGPGAPIVLPKATEKPDYEAEFAFVIGPGGRNIPAAKWREHVYGYMCLNDVSARDLQMATTQWLMGKSPDTFAPSGPWLTTADEIADPHALDIKLTINGETLQSSNTKNLIFGIPVLLEYLSATMTLEPGDIVTTGTPAGVGFAHKPPRWLRPGDSVTVEIEGLGALTNPVVAEE